MGQTVARGCNRTFNFRRWFSNTLRYYIVKKIFSALFKKNDQISFMTNSPSTVILLKTLSSVTSLDG
jgi:hypothetical protein